MAIKFLNTVQVDTDVLYVDAANDRVGIGTDNPDTALHVAGSSTLASQSTVLKIENTADQGSSQDIHIYNQYDRDIGIKFETLGGTNYIWQDSNSDDALIISTGGNSRANDAALILEQDQDVIVPNGRLGIGATNPSAKLEVSAGATASVDIAHFSNSNNIAKAKISLSANSSGELSLIDGSNNTDVFITSNGNSYFNSGKVGIGTTSPGASLEVASTTDDYVAKFSHSTATGYAPGSILLQAGQGNSRGQGLFHYNTEADENWFTGVPYNVQSKKWIVANKYSTTQDVDTAQLTHALLTIDSDTGNVGIGTTSPGYKLDVSGDARFTSDITVGNTAGSQINMLRTSANYINATNNTGYLVFRTGGYDTALTLNASQNATFAGDLTVSGGDITLGGTGRIQGVDTVSASTDAANKAYVDNAIAGAPQMVKFNRSGINSSTYTMLATVNGNNLASILKMTMTGTSSGVVFACTFDITVNHHKDIHVKSSNGDYTEVTLRITSNDNEDFSIEAKHNGNTTTTAEVCIYPLADEIITPTTTDPGYTGAEYEHTATEGWRYGGEDGNVESSNVIVDGKIGIGTTSPDAKLDIHYFTSGGNDDLLNIGLDATNPTRAKIYTENYDGNFGLWNSGSTQQVKVSSDGDSYFNGGNVGIGTTSPVTKLEVAGDVTISGDTKDLIFSNTAETKAGIVFTDAQAGTGQAAAIKFDCSAETLDFFVNDESAERMSINTSGVLTINGGNIILSGIGRIQGVDTVSASTDAVNKSYVDTELGNYLPVNNPTFTGTLTGPSATITGNTLLGNSNGDYVHVNDRLFVGATDSGNAEFWFGEGTTGDVNYGAHWHWDSGYTHKWFTVNNSSETLMMSYATNDTSKVNWYRDVDIQDNDILIDSSHGFINSGGWTRNTTPSGYIEFGPANTTWAHIYTDRPNFYFNKELYVNNQRVYNTGYHPEADKWTTARTLTLTGYATGSVSWDGSGNASMTTAVAKIKAGGNGPSTENLNSVADSVSVGQLEYRGFNSSSSNKPPTSDNANGVITVGQHSGNYNAQLAFSSNGNMYWRDNPSTGYGSWRTMWDSGNDGAGSGLDADLLDGQQGSYYLDYANFTGTPTIPSVGNGQIDGRTSGLGLSGSMDATANQSGNTTFTVTSNAVTAANANTIAYRTSSADIRARLFRSNYQNQTTISGGMAFRVNNGADDYIRFCTDKAAIRTFLGVPASGDLNNYLLNNASDTLQKDQNADTSLTIRNNTNGTAASASLDLRVSGNNFDLTTHSDLFTGKLNVTEFKSTAGGSSFTFTPAGSTIMTMTGSFVEILGYLRMTGDIRGNGQQLILNAGESANYATGQTAEYVYTNAENGLVVSSSPDNWSSGWAGRNTTYIGKADGTSSFPGKISVQGSNVIEIDQGTSSFNHVKVLSTFGSKLFSATNYGYVLEGSSTSASPVTFRFDNDRYRIYSGSSGEALTVLANTKVGINNTNPTYQLHVSGNAGFTGQTTHSSGLLTSSSQTRNKISVWSSLSSYTIGMKSGFGYGGLGGDSTGTNYAMSFQMSNTNDRGWWWGDTSHSDVQGSMSLTTDGELVVAKSLSVGAGETTRTAADRPLEVTGNALIDGRLTIEGPAPIATSPMLELHRTSPVVDYKDLNSAGYFSLKERFLNSGSTVIGSREVSQNPGGSGIYHNFDNGASGGSQFHQRQNSFHWKINSTSEKLTLGTNGYIGINDTSPSYQLDVNGSGRFTSTVTATNFILSSDERLKENVKKVCDNRVKADWKTFELKADKGQKRYGVIAQELEKTNPEFVREDSEGFKSVAYIDLLIAKIAELETRIQKLEK